MNRFDLNEAQRQSVLSDAKHALILAGAGTGKTRTLTARIYHLLTQQQIHPSQILALTFTNKAAEELTDRLSNLTLSLGGAFFGTFHAFCYRLLTTCFGQAFLLDETDQLTLIERLLSADNYYQLTAVRVATYINQNKTNVQRANQLQPTSGVQEFLRDFYQKYETYCKERYLYDYDELIFTILELLRTAHPRLMEYFPYRYVLIDEFQDINTLQYHFIQTLVKHGCSIYAYGDDDQTIYTWRGSSVKNLTNFVEQNQAVIYKLERNYRSNALIINASNAVIANNAERMEKTLFTDKRAQSKISALQAASTQEEVAYVIQKINEYLKTYRQAAIAVLCRTKADFIYFEKEFIINSIDYNLMGANYFFAKKEVKDVLAYLRLCHYGLEQIEDIVLLRIINFPARRIGNVLIENIAQYAKRQNCRLGQALLHMRSGGLIKSSKNKGLYQFMTTIEKLVKLLRPLTIHAKIQKLIEEMRLMSYYEQRAFDVLEQLKTLAYDWDRKYAFNVHEEALIAFLSLSLYVPHISNKKASVFLSTAHSVKGLEFDCVFVTGLAQNHFPYHKSLLEDERRLFYMCMTRAKNHLFLTASETVQRYNNKRQVFKFSDFFNELPAQLVDLTCHSRYDALRLRVPELVRGLSTVRRIGRFK